MFGRSASSDAAHVDLRSRRSRPGSTEGTRFCAPRRSSTRRPVTSCSPDSAVTRGRGQRLLRFARFCAVMVICSSIATPRRRAGPRTVNAPVARRMEPASTSRPASIAGEVIRWPSRRARDRIGRSAARQARRESAPARDGWCPASFLVRQCRTTPWRGCAWPSGRHARKGYRGAAYRHRLRKVRNRLATNVRGARRSRPLAASYNNVAADPSVRRIIGVKISLHRQPHLPPGGDGVRSVHHESCSIDSR